MLIILLFQLFGDGGIDKIARINAYKEAATKAYANEDYKTAVSKYKYLVDTLGVKEDEVILNLGHAFVKAEEPDKAEGYYGMLVESDNKTIKSQALQQLGKLQFDKEQYQRALQHYKNALKAAPSNEAARYNYEMLKKYLAENQQDQQNQNKDKLEPSEFAIKIKKQADQFVKNNQFMQAYYTMERGKEMDTTVNAYNDYIRRLLDVNEVEYQNTQKNNNEN